ncbi:unnamed protein product [Mytilus edulis]|uniref:B box-type domain-containing protein n=1 Tax=Mytilus edulis TaxID=6550 RepID=A0A8S3TMC6_MYTED|nr:unnamed protein product [Mytilus edulis]
MTASLQSCDVCDLRHITKPSIGWCTECDEGLCTECKEYHSLSKASRSHSVIPIAEYQKLPANVLKIVKNCASHDKRYQFYCYKHACPCCSKCMMESHKECQGLVELDDVIHSVKTSNALCEIEETVVEIAENLKKICQHQHDNLLNLKEKRKEIEKEIKKTRMKINSHLDKLQDDLMKQLNELEEKESSKNCKLLSSLEKKEKEIGECQNNLLNIKKHATDLQMFLIMKQIEEEVYNKESFLQDNEGKEHHTLSYKTNTSIQNIISDIRSFGEVRIESNPCDIVLIKKKAKQAQLTVPIVSTKSIENIKLTTHKTIDTQGDFIHGCCMLSDGRMAFSHHDDKTVRVFNDKGSKDFEVEMPCHPFDIVYISGNNTLAVTSGSSVMMGIYIIDLVTKQIMKTISLNSYIDGITPNGNQLIYSGRDNGIQMISLEDESLRDVVRDKMPVYCYIATLRDNIYHTNYLINSVTCYNLQVCRWNLKIRAIYQFLKQSRDKYLPGKPDGSEFYFNLKVCLMAASFQSCGVCDLRHITKPCIVWCTECDEGLCSECKEHHSLSKSSRSHSVIPIAEYQKLPADVLKITQYCTSHDKKYQFYCQKHECPCCSTCIVECHKECREIVELENIIRNAKSSNAMCEIEESLVEIAENLKKIRHHEQNNLLTIKEKEKKSKKN